MSYVYADHRAFVFTEEGQKDFLKVRDKAKELLTKSGAVTSQYLTQDLTGLSWNHLACVDRLVELGELLEVQNPHHHWGQHRIYVGKYED